MLPGHEVAELMRQAQYPLADGYDGEHLVDEVSGALDHAPATARGTEASSLARERNEAFEAAVATPHSRKPIGQHAALEEATQLALYEARQTSTVAAAGGVFDESRQMLLHHLVQHRRFGLARLVVVGHDPRRRSALTGWFELSHVAQGEQEPCRARAGSSCALERGEGGGRHGGGVAAATVQTGMTVA
jgi:hypothetical protein